MTVAEFDPYLKWLGIRDPARPPHHYALLGLAPFETDADVIAHAADRQMAHVKTFQTGNYAAWSQRLLNELAAARLCLLDPVRRQRYDVELRERLATASFQWADTIEVPTTELADARPESDQEESSRTVPSAGGSPAFKAEPIGATDPGTGLPSIRTAEATPRSCSQRGLSLGWATVAGASGLALVAFVGWGLLQWSPSVPTEPAIATPPASAALPPNVAPPPPADVAQDAPPTVAAQEPRPTEPPHNEDAAPDTVEPEDDAFANSAANLAVTHSLKAVERALSERRLEEAAALLRALPREAVPTAQHTTWDAMSWRVEQLSLFWDALRQACRNLGADAKLNQGNQSWSILGFENDALRIAQAEGETRLPLSNLPANTLADLAQSVLASRSPAEQASLAVFLAEDREPDRDRALAVLSACARQGFEVREFGERLGLPVAEAVRTTNAEPTMPPAAPTDAPPTPHARLPYPDAAALQAARTKVRDTLTDRFASAHAAEDQESLARDLLRAATGDTVEPAERAAAFAEALALAHAAARPALAYEILSARAEWFSADLIAERLETLAVLARAGIATEVAEEVAQRALELVEQALRADQYELAEKAAHLAVTAARRLRDPPARQRARLVQDEARAQQARWKQVQPANEAIQAGRGSPADCLAMGLFRCLDQGRWDEGLPLLADGNDPAVSDLARRDLANPTELEAQLEVAHAWWKYQAALPQRTRKQAAARAALWYQRALPALQGVERTRAESRLQEAAQLAGPTTTGRGTSPRELPPLRVLPLRNGEEIRFHLVQSGAFRMGVAGQTRVVTLTKPFYLAESELTQSQWNAVLESNPSRLLAQGTGKLPVNNVSWQDCQAWLSAANELLPEKSGTLRLPTEAEWEYACRAGNAGEFSFGDDTSQLITYGWFYPDNAAGRPHEVGMLQPNAWGFFDMHGNMLEWCQDWYAELPLTALLDPSGPAGGSEKVLRGGGFAHRADDCRAGARQHAVPERREVYFGFRPAWESP